MGVKYTSTIKGLRFGVTWDVEIIDNSSTGVSDAIILGAEPTLEYESQNDNRYQPIKGSKLTLPVMVDSDGLRDWLLNTVNNAKEETFYVKLYKNTVLYWCGVLLHDLNQREDASYPYEFTLTFTDGLARLKKYEFTNLTTNNLNQINYYIFEALKKVPLYDQIGSTDTLWSNSINWYEANMPAVTNTTDPFAQSWVRRWAFCDTEEDGTRIAWTYYDVLEQILEQFHARIILSGGYFKIVQVNVYENITFKERTYKKDGTLKAGSIVQWQSVINQSTQWVASGANVWQYFPALKEIYVKYPFENNNLINSNAALTTAQSFVDLLGGTDKKLRFRVSGTAFHTLAVNGQSRLAITLKIKVGSYYLKTDIFTGDVTWTTTNTDRYLFLIPASGYATNFSLLVVTPDMPAGTHTGNEIQITSYNVFNYVTGTTYTINSIVFTPGSQILDFYSEDSFFDFTFRNTSNLINSEDIELRDARFGDGPFELFNGALFTGGSTVGSEVFSTGLWSINKTGSTTDLISLSCIEILSGQIIPNPRYQGQIHANYNAYETIVYNGEDYVINGASLNLAQMMWQGEWFKIYTQRASTIDVGPQTATRNNEGLKTQEALQTHNDAINGLQELETKYSIERLVCVIDTDLTGSITSLTCTATTEDLYIGDKVVVITTHGTLLYTFTLDANASAGATSLSVTSQTISETIGEGSLIFISAKTPSFENIRIIECADPNAVFGPGSIQYCEGNFYAWDDQRQAIMTSGGVLLDTVEVTNTTTETEIYSYTYAPNQLVATTKKTCVLSGEYSNASASDQFTIRFYLDGTLHETLTRTGGNLTNAGWKAQFEMTMRTDGVSGVFVHYADLLDGTRIYAKADTTENTIDTTAEIVFSVTVQWDNAKTGNIFYITQGNLRFAE